MFLTNRETLLLTELMNSTGPVSLDRMMQVLKVSKRTVYRELANLEKSLETVGATLEGRSWSFPNFCIRNEHSPLQEAIMADTDQEFAASERQHRILLQLTTATKPVSSHFFLDRYQISNTTFFRYQTARRKSRTVAVKDRAQSRYEIEGSENIGG